MTMDENQLSHSGDLKDQKDQSESSYTGTCISVNLWETPTKNLA